MSLRVPQNSSVTVATDLEQLFKKDEFVFWSELVRQVGKNLRCVRRQVGRLVGAVSYVSSPTSICIL